MGLTIIIPTLNEAATISETLSAIQQAGPQEILVVDGGSTDATTHLARQAGAVVLSSAPGRGTQQALGVEHARGDLLLFLHADTKLPPDYPALIAKTLNEPHVAGGAFRFKLDEAGWGFRCIEWLVDWRCRLFELPYGDQAIFVRAATLQEAGGFPSQPVMEDYELVCRLRKLGRIRIADADAITSARRWQKLGILRAACSNVASLVAYKLGASPQTIAKRRRV